MTEQKVLLCVEFADFRFCPSKVGQRSLLDKYCWFSVLSHSKKIKIKIKTVQWINYRVLEMKGGKYAKTLAKIQVTRIFCIQDMRRNVLPTFIKICMETPCWCPPVWAPTWRTETNKNICDRVLVQKRGFIPRGTHKH